MMVIPLIIFGLFFVVPSTIGYLYAFTDWSSFVSDFSFVGLQNFVDVMTERTVPTAFVNTLIFAVLKRLL